jgi:pilus assembly protein CpaB
MSSRRRIVGVVAAVGLAVAGTFALVAYVQSAEDRALAGERVVDVYVATQPIPAGTPANELTGKVRRERVPAKVQANGAIARLGEINGSVAQIDLVPGEQLLKSRFAAPGSSPSQRSPGGTKIPAGWFQSTVLLEPAQALGGTVKAGQRVTVVASVSGGITPNGPVSGVVVRNGLVTNVQIDGDRGEDVDRKRLTEAPTGKFLVTLAVPQTELERLVYAADQGQIWLATEPDVR